MCDENHHMCDREPFLLAKLLYNNNNKLIIKIMENLVQILIELADGISGPVNLFFAIVTAGGNLQAIGGDHLFGHP